MLFNLTFHPALEFVFHVSTWLKITHYCFENYCSATHLQVDDGVIPKRRTRSMLNEMTRARHIAMITNDLTIDTKIFI